jgi:hypothetical protein
MSRNQAIMQINMAIRRCGMQKKARMLCPAIAFSLIGTIIIQNRKYITGEIETLAETLNGAMDEKSFLDALKKPYFETYERP